MLEEGSAIAPDVTSGRGVRSISAGRDLPEGFSRRQRRRAPGILFSAHRPSGEMSYIFRPDEPAPKSPGHKYEQPCKSLGAAGNVLDVHPSVHHLIADRCTSVIFVEGIKKADAITSAARREGLQILAVAISGVWNWMADGEPIPDMFDIPLEGRKVIIGFDSDMMHNPDVQDAAKRLAGHLIGRGAEVWIIYLPDQADGSKMGLDDFFAGGGTIPELRLLIRRYDPADFVRIRLNRSERLRLALEDLERTFWETEWKGMGGHSARDVYLKLREAARRHGKIVEDGIRVKKAQGPLALEAKVSPRTLWKALNRLEEWGLLYRDNEGRKPDKTGAFVLRANVSQYERGVGFPDNATTPLQALYARDLHLRAPRLRWSRPKFTPKRGLVAGTRRVRRSVKLRPRDPIKRLGKIRGAIIDVLDAAGGSATLQEIAEALHRKRPRDIRRRNLPMLEEEGIITVDGDVVSLTEDWEERLHQARLLGGEASGFLKMVVDGEERVVPVQGADERAAERHRLKSRAFRNRKNAQPSDHWTNTGADGAIEDLEPEEGNKLTGHSEGEPEVSALAAAVRDYLNLSPHDACQPPGWIGVTLWAEGLYPKLDAPAAEVWAAIDELGGEAYLRERLEAARGAVA